MKKTVIAALAAVMCASASMADLLTVNANAADAGWQQSGVIFSWTGAANCRVGSLTATNRGSYTIPFQLPVLPEGHAVSDVVLNFYVQSTTLFFPVENINMDILGGRVSIAPTVLASDWNSGSVIAANVTPLTVNSSQVPLTPVGAYSFTLDKTFLQNIYDTDASAAGKYVFFTLYPDNVTTSGANRYVVITTAEGTTAANRPTLAITTAIPEPATIGMLGLGALVAVLIRRVKS